MEPNSDISQPQPTLPPAPPVSPVVPTSKPKGHVVLFIGGILILGLGFTIGLLFNKNLSPTSQISPTPTPLFSPTPQEKPDPAQRDTANWKIYTIEKFGIQFKLPEQLSTLGSLDIKECAGEKGMEFSATLPSKKSSGSLISIVYAGGGCAAHNLFSIGTVSSDYEAGRSRRFTDTNGYFSKTGTYYCVGPGAVRNDEIPSHLVKEIVSKNGVPLLRIIGEDESYGTWPKLCTPGSGKIGALVNLSKNITFPGIAIQMDVTNQLSENLFDQILSTFKFIDQSSSASKWQGYDYLENEVYTTNGWFDFQSKKGTIHYVFNFPWDWKKAGSVFLDENGTKAAELSPGGVETKPGQTCFDKFDVSAMIGRVKIISTTPIVINDLTGVRQVQEVQYEGGGGKKYTGTWYPNVYCLQKENKAFVMTFYEITLNSGKQSLFEKILATFDFVN